ncbi:MAG: peptidyl-tRNA hydrolase [Actinomycetota bacterium]|nr:peptidyl-tRNA hydrolase [Actinomycetota bacterium]
MAVTPDVPEPVEVERPEVERPEVEPDPWALQLVVRVERASPPSATAALEAAAMAVVALLADERTADLDGPWREPVRRWSSGRIRKIAKRARGARWDAVGALDGVTVAHRGAEARALVPGPIATAPPALAKLQVSGLELDDPDRVEVPPPGWSGPVLALNPSVEMSTGKLAAQVGHGAHLLWAASDADQRRRWLDDDLALVVVHPDEARWNQLVPSATVAVRDGGFTEVAPGTMTVVALRA